MIRLRVFGSVELRDGDGAELRGLITQPKRLALLVYLAMRPPGTFARRDTLFAMFWPESDETHARASLNQAVRFLRRHLGDDVIVSRGTEELGINAGAFWCDAVEFRDRISHGDPEAGLALYQGDLLSGFHVHDADGFETWSDGERTAFRSCAADAACVVAERRELAGDFSAAVHSAESALELSDVDERRMRDLLALLDRLGDRAGAIAAFDRFAARLDAEYGTRPSAETTALVERIRSRANVRASVLESLVVEPGAPTMHGEPPADVASLPARTARAPTAPWRWRWILAGSWLLVAMGFIIVRGRSPKALVAGFAQAIAATEALELDPALSPDGRFIAYASGTWRNTRIYVRPVSGGAAIPRSDGVPGDHRWPTWTADGSSIVFVAQRHDRGLQVGHAFITPAFSGAPRRLFDASDMLMTPSISDDGKLLLYSDGSRILARPLLGGPPRVIAAGTDVHSPVLAPDGRRVAYVQGNLPLFDSFNVAASSLWLTDLDGSPPLRVSDSTHMNFSPAWRRDARSLLFISDVAGQRDVYEQPLSRTYRPAGVPSRLTTGVGAISISVARDGEAMTYAAARIRAEIWAAPLAPHEATGASAMQRLTNVRETIEGLDVSRDGAWLVFDSNRRGNQDVYKVPVSGGEPVQLTHDPAPDFIPQWSPDGRYIAYYSMRTGNRDVRVMNAEGGEDQAVTEEPGDDLYPSWAPDGRTIVYWRLTSGSGSLLVRTRLPNGRWSSPRAINTNGAAPRFPRWSWDGRWIAYNVNTSELKVVSPHSGESRTIATASTLGGETISYAAWGPSSDVVYVHTIVAFWSVPIAGGTPRRLLDPRRFGRYTRRQEFATDGKRLFFTLAADESDVWLTRLKR